VFVTAHVEHAVAAFQRHTVDYVLKPLSNERINEALDRASRRAQGERAAKLIEALPQLQKLSRPCHPMIAIKAKGRILFINPGDVVAVQAEGNYVLLQRESDSYLLRESISMVAEKLKPYGFIRIQRSALVNTSFVVEIKPYSTGKYGLRVKGGKEYAVTSGYKKNLRPLTEFRIGSGMFLAEYWSGRRDLNPRLRPWQGRTLPLSYSRSAASIINKPEVGPAIGHAAVVRQPLALGPDPVKRKLTSGARIRSKR
jgi:CheY-like chemotaxis protein